jgi:hypothetical protein
VTGPGHSNRDTGSDWPSTGSGGLRHRFRYRFDNLLSRGTWAVLLWLGAVTVVAVLVSSALLAAFGVTFSGSENASWIEDFWQSLLRVLDPGTMAADGGWGRRVLALLVTLFGILIAGTLIGLIASGVEQRVEQMQRGRSAVVETGHIVVLGASSRLPAIVEQLAASGRSRRDNAIVVLADREPAELRDAVRATAAGLQGSRLVVRSGQTDRVSDLAMVGVQDARAVIAVADDDAENDADVVKAVLAVGAALGGFGRVPIVAEMTDPDMGRRLVGACGGSVHPVLAVLAIARITSFSLRKPGLVGVVEELLDHRGSGIRVRDAGDLAGVPFGEIVRRFDTARPIGTLRADGSVELNPGAGSRLDEGDRLVLIAEDADFGAPATEPFPGDTPGPETVRSRSLGHPHKEHLLVVGWNALGAALLASVEQSSPSGSSAEIVYDPDLFEAGELPVPTEGGLGIALTPSPRLTWELGDEAQTRHVTAIVLLGYRRGLSAGEADSRTLLSLMLLRQELEARHGVSPRVVVELRDADNVDLARLSGADEYIVSDAVASRFMTQLAEQPDRRAVLLTLYAPGGPSLHLVAAGDLGLTGTVRCEHIIATAQSFGLLAIGWRQHPEQGGEAVLNPDGARTVDLAADDQIVVID